MATLSLRMNADFQANSDYQIAAAVASLIA
jgi:hypothetical protein